MHLRKLMAKKVENTFIPKFIPNDLPWHQRDGLMTWHDQNKCNNFLEDTDEHFQMMQIVNFGMIRNELSEDKLKQYQEIDHQEIMSYPPELRQQVFSSIFHNVKRQGKYVKKEAVKEHFKVDNKVAVGRGRFLKKIRDNDCAET